MHGGAKSSVTLTRGEPISQSGRCLGKMSDDRTQKNNSAFLILWKCVEIFGHLL